MSTIESAYIKSKDLDNDDESSETTSKERPGVSTATHKQNYQEDVPVSTRGKVAGMSQGKLFGLKELVDKHLVYPGMSDTVLLNTYRNLRTKLLARSTTDNFVTLITSVVPGSGGSRVAANLAATFAFDESKTTMLVEANLLNPTLNSLLEVNSDRGLIDYLQYEDIEVSDVINETPIERLRFVPSGEVKENSSEFLSSNRMKAFVDQIVSRYPNRYPIIDAPSITTSADTQILVDICDQVVLVVPYGKCTEDEVKYAATAIGREKLAGLVLNEF